MAATMRSYVKRKFEDRLVNAVECLDCDQPRGQRCRDQHGRERMTCCGARADLGMDILRADAELRMLLISFGVISIEDEWSS